MGGQQGRRLRVLGAVGSTPERLDFAKKILKDHGVPTDDSDDNAPQLLGWTEATATPQVEIARGHHHRPGRRGRWSQR
jgi:hypothetical protein